MLILSFIKKYCLLAFCLGFIALVLEDLFLFDLKLSDKGLEFVMVFLVVFSDQFQALLFVLRFPNRILLDLIFDYFDLI